MPSGLLVLLVDDDVDDQEIFSMSIEEIDHSVTCVFANDGVQAIDKFMADNLLIPHVIFIDINMPRMNGLECLKELKKIKRLNHIPVYMYSTFAAPNIIDECLRLGATGYIKKEIDPADLKRNLSNILSTLTSSTN